MHENPTLVLQILYYVSCVLNFGAALWMAYYFTQQRGSEPWLVRMPVLLAGLFYTMVAVFMFKHPEFASMASQVYWWWAVALVGLLALLHNVKPDMVTFPVMRVATYLGAIIAVWGTVIVFTESSKLYDGQASFGGLATNFGFFAANIAAAVWVVTIALRNKAQMLARRILHIGIGSAYGAVVLSAVLTMQMVAESPY